MKRIFIVLMAMFMCISANAQYVGNKIFDNVQIGLKGGAIIPVDAFGWDYTRPTVSLELTKYITPVVGFAVEGTFGINTYFKDFAVSSRDGLIDESVVSGLMKFNLSGYNRVIDVVPFTGLGWGYIWHGDTRNFITFEAGTEVNFNVDDALQINVVPNIIWKPATKDNLMKLSSTQAFVGLEAGLTYKFKTSNGTHDFVKVRPYDVQEVAALNAKIDALTKALNKRHAPRKSEVIVKEVVKEVVKNNTANVWFDVNSYELKEEAKSILDKVEGEVVVTGYASQDGPTKFNQELSEKRAQAVADYLKARGVRVEEVVGKGEAPNTFSRVVIVDKK